MSIVTSCSLAFPQTNNLYVPFGKTLISVVIVPNDGCFQVALAFEKHGLAARALVYALFGTACILSDLISSFRLSH